MVDLATYSELLAQVLDNRTSETSRGLHNSLCLFSRGAICFSQSRIHSYHAHLVGSVDKSLVLADVIAARCQGRESIALTLGSNKAHPSVKSATVLSLGVILRPVV